MRANVSPIWRHSVISLTVLARTKPAGLPKAALEAVRAVHKIGSRIETPVQFRYEATPGVAPPRCFRSAHEWEEGKRVAVGDLGGSLGRDIGVRCKHGAELPGCQAIQIGLNATVHSATGALGCVLRRWLVAVANCRWGLRPKMRRRRRRPFSLYWDPGANTDMPTIYGTLPLSMY